MFQAANVAAVLLALALASAMLWARRDAVFSLVVVWAVYGISTKQVGTPIIYYTTLAVMGLGITAMLLIPIIRKMNWVTYYFS